MMMPKGVVLVVDDNELNRVLLTTQLQREGCSVLTAQSGRQALEVLGRQPCDVVLLDLVMPEMDGFQVLAYMKADPALRHIPVIVVSAVHEMDSVVRSIQMGAADHLAKPFDSALLRARLNASLATKRLHDQEIAHRARERQLVQQSHITSALLDKITHELRSPFVAAGFSVQLLQRYLEHGMLDELRAQIRQLDQQLTEGRRMIDGVISFAALVTKRVEVRPAPVDMAALLDEAVAPLRRLAKTRKVTLELEVVADLPQVLLDREQMGEAIHHLVHNAIKFNREGGRVQVACRIEGPWLVCTVEDTGRGVAPEQLGTIWEAFTQAADNRRRSVEGLGIGLALVKHIVEAHRGEVIASSTPGAGSVFGFRIPTDPGGRE